MAALATGRRLLLPFVLAAGAGGPLAADEPPALVCYGNEPTWRLDLAGAEARLAVSGEEEKEYSGRFTSLDRVKAHAWRGRAAPAPEGEVVTIVDEESCNDGMSDQRRPYSARLSLPDGRLFAGCCRLATVWNAADANRKAQAPPSASSTTATPPAPAAPKTAPAAPADWAAALQSFLPALRICTFEALRTEAVLFAEQRPDHSVHMLLRLPNKVYADCDVNPAGTAKLNRRSKDKELLPQEQGAMLTLFPGSPPREPCYKNEHALDSEGNPFGWISRKGC